MPTAEQIKELRSLTGCGIIDCKEALSEAGDDVEQAILSLRKKGISKASKKADRNTAEGYIASYLHGNNKIATILALHCETDFVARNEKFQQLAKDIAMHVAAMDPAAVNPDDISPETLEAEETLAKEQAAESGKPAEIQAKMVEGKIKKFKEEKALMTQPFVKDANKTIEDLIKESVAELGENISVGEFRRLSI